MLSILRLDVLAMPYQYTIIKYSYSGPPRAGLGPGEIFFGVAPSKGEKSTLSWSDLSLV